VRISLSDQQARFRDDIRSFLATELPTDIAEKVRLNRGVGKEDVARWTKIPNRRGWAAPSWPEEHGGTGWSLIQRHVFDVECRGKHAPVLSGFGFNMVGPAIIKYGSKTQRKRFLPRILNADLWWCQGYSEPSAGSDLASLRTKAEDAGDHFVINGQKIWTTAANSADWIFCLVRTKPEGPKHDGISFVLFTMDQPGVTVKPIQLISGASPFCETFFDNAIASKDDLIGRLNAGWTVAKRLLQYERTSIGGIGGGTQQVEPLEDTARRYLGACNGAIADPSLRENVIDHRMNDRAYVLTMRRSLEESQTGKAPGAASSMFKYYGTEQNKRRYELLMSIRGSQGVGWSGQSFDDEELTATRAWLRSKGNSIEGGTSEVQLNILAKRVLGLPD